MLIHDSHLHLFTRGILEEWSRRRRQDPRLQVAAARRLRRHVPPAREPAESAADAARRWLAEFDACGIGRGVFLAPYSPCPDLHEFIAASDRFLGYAWLDASKPESVRLLEEEVRAGMRGVKLYPLTQWFHVDDRACYPFYEKCAELAIPVLIHFGISLGYDSDLRYGNPLSLHPVARDFPEVTFIIAHFGAGFMRECLFLAYQCENVCFDTSGSNSWRRYQAPGLSLKEVFERFLDCAGPERILYGSDSTFFPRGYRREVLAEQLAVLDALELPEPARRLVLGGNLLRILRLEEGSPQGL
ncbi:MAG TPA: amidohydrolase family protein [Candidatus Nitrosotenuis sp.]|jgi:predicted TIM-barrel fold metal-dependent hydrolase|nr:amidohydrolase family protein [Candidatus Nitrosotenuis sp.]